MPRVEIRLSSALYSKHWARYLAHSMQWMFAERMKSDNTASHLYGAWCFYQLPKVHKAAILFLLWRWGNLGTNEDMPQPHSLWSLGMDDFYTRFSYSHLSMTPIPTVFTCICWGHDRYRCPAQLSADVQVHQITSTWTLATCSSVKVSRDKTYLVSSGSIPSNQLPKLWIHSSLDHRTSSSGTINMTL